MWWLNQLVRGLAWKIFPNMPAQEGAEEASGKVGLRNWKTIVVGISEGIQASTEHE